MAAVSSSVGGMDASDPRWVSEGRIGVASLGPDSGTHVFVYREPTRDEWWVVRGGVEPKEQRISTLSTHGMAEYEAAHGLEWLRPSRREGVIEAEQFALRPLPASFRTVRVPPVAADRIVRGGKVVLHSPGAMWVSLPLSLFYGSVISAFLINAGREHLPLLVVAFCALAEAVCVFVIVRAPFVRIRVLSEQMQMQVHGWIRIRRINLSNVAALSAGDYDTPMPLGVLWIYLETYLASLKIVGADGNSLLLGEIFGTPRQVRKLIANLGYLER